MRKLLRRRSLAAFLGLSLAIAQAFGQEPPHSGASGGKMAGNVEVLSDTKGVDFGSYLSEMLKKVRTNWYNLIPEEARQPKLTPGVTTIEFAILPDGHVAGMKLVHQSGSVSLDRAAWGGITASSPFSPLPKAFTGPFLALRFRFFYNPSKLPPEERPEPPPANTDAKNPS